MWSTPEGFDVILATPEMVLVPQHRPDAEGLISIPNASKQKVMFYHYPGGSWLSYQDSLHSERG
jgi:hypothetical protein